MGGKSSSSSSQENNTTTNQTDRRIGATDQAVVIAPEANSPIELTLTDDLAFKTVNDAGELISITVDRAFDSIDQVSGAFAAVKAKDAENTGELSSTIKEIAKYAAIGAVGYGAIKLLGK